VYFSPEDQPSRTLICVFDHAQRQILFAIYDLTSRPIADALIQAKRRHVDVWGIMDARESRSRGNLYPELSLRSETTWCCALEPAGTALCTTNAPWRTAPS